MGKFKKVFGRLADPRAANARHDLLEVLVIALAAVLCGAETCSDMAEFGQAKEELLRLFLRLEHGVPSHDTFSRVFRLLKPEAFEAAFRRFMAAFAKANRLNLTGVIAVDGKALRGAFARGSRYQPLHLVNVWAVEARMSLAQQKAPGRNETKGALEVLALLSLEGCIVTADALHCHRAMAKTVLDRGGDYVLAIKANRGPLFKAVVGQFARSGERRAAKKVESSTHDRHEARRATIMRIPAWLPSTASRAWLRLAASPRAGSCGATAPSRRSCAITCSPSPCPPSGCCRSHAVIGPSRTNCTGYSTSTSTRTATDREWTMPPRTSPSCAGSRSTSFDLVLVPVPYVGKSSAPAGTTASSSPCSAICDSPAHKGGREPHLCCRAIFVSLHSTRNATPSRLHDPGIASLLSAASAYR